MCDLTPERREALRNLIEDRYCVTIRATEVLALLDAADERDRLDEIESRLSVLLWRLTNGRLDRLRVAGNAVVPAVIAGIWAQVEAEAVAA